MSFGLTEDNFTASELAACDAVFTTPANHIGITFVASAGDDGAGIQQRYPNNVLRVTTDSSRPNTRPALPT